MQVDGTPEEQVQSLSIAGATLGPGNLLIADSQPVHMKLALPPRPEGEGK
jgi:hypothetical protein